jgi:hypothetical protein
MSSAVNEGAVAYVICVQVHVPWVYPFKQYVIHGDPEEAAAALPLSDASVCHETKAGGLGVMRSVLIQLLRRLEPPIVVIVRGADERQALVIQGHEPLRHVSWDAESSLGQALEVTGDRVQGPANVQSQNVACFES